MGCALALSIKERESEREKEMGKKKQANIEKSTRYGFYTMDEVH